MKRLIFKLSLFTMALLVVNCSNQLDEQQELVVVSDEIDYGSQQAALGALIGAYQKFQFLRWADVPLISVKGDDVNAGGLGDQPPFADTDRYIYDNTFWMYNQLWQAWFQNAIQYTAQMNQLDKFRDGGVSSSLIDQYKAECMVLRGFTHLVLSRVFGDVYIIESTDQSTIQVYTMSEVMEWISSQMDEAIPNLPDLRPNQRTDLPGGVTKYTALAIKAMANQELGNYQAVADATGEIINSGKFELYNDFYQLFKKPGELSNESILEVQYTDLNQSSGTNISHLQAFYGPQNWTAANGTATSGWGFFEPSFKWIQFMLNRNEKVRLETSVLVTNRGIAELRAQGYSGDLPSFFTNTTRDGDIINDYSRAYFASGKHYLPSIQLTDGRNSYGTAKNYIVIRYSEILLMYAEALTRGATGSAGTADQAVNLVRARAGLSPLSGVTTNQVLDEKFAELAMEWGIRYYDMVRLEKTAELSYDGRTFSMDKRFLPYPQAQLDNSTVLREYVENNN